MPETEVGRQAREALQPFLERREFEHPHEDRASRLAWQEGWLEGWHVADLRRSAP